MISLSYCTSMAVASLKSSKLRTGLTALGIIIGIAAVITTFTLGDSMEAYISSEMDQGPTYIEIQASRERVFYDQQADIVRNTPGVDSVTVEWSDTADVTYSKEVQNTLVTGTNEDLVDIMGLTVSEGRFITNKDTYAAAIGIDVANDTFDKDIGVRNTIDITIYNSETKEYVTQRFTVVGIVGEDTEIGFSFGNSAIYIPIETMQALSGRTDYNVITAIVEDKETINETEDEIKSRLGRSLGISERDLDDEDKMPFTTSNTVETAEAMSSMMDTLQYFLVGIGSISLIVGSVGIMNIMVVTVTERTKEIGTLKALGYSSKDVLIMFVVESIIISLIGGLIGTVVGLIMAYVVTFLLGMPMAFPFSTILMGIGLSVLVGVLAGAQPSYRAAKMNPVDALRSI